ncbi:DUF4222 domain-containing protein [Salmonella enterica]|nr:DUF4222 domain-containing protein [Salmonella enterica]EAX3607187.1 DUF4222 domain-containing protein [Salmonella enterica]EGW6280823.1 DUF4222 domain-containing protein [Salmonella enterica]EGX3932511.1 DUF4222 domain-containing protein [Salmonella enterica]
MKKFNSGFTASGRSQPEIRQGGKWRDGQGDIVTIKNHSFNRVIFIREGYEQMYTKMTDVRDGKLCLSAFGRESFTMLHDDYIRMLQTEGMPDAPVMH